jgi:hypothetical protein
MAGGAAEMLPVPLSCPLPLQRSHPPHYYLVDFIFAEMGATGTASGWLVDLFSRNMLPKSMQTNKAGP